MSALWDLLREARCSITEIPSDRWCLERFGHPRAGERGRSYSWAAGVLDDIWGFDPGVFGLSPREAEQMDPQQRLLLELCWEALEDAGLPPSGLAGSDTGVFVGASTVDHGQSRLLDMAGTDAYFATGNAASILANRISYVFDFRGPSFVVDTACSSSLVALDAAVQALQSGRIHTAIVGGVSILGTPFQFVSFSQAAMLSRTGLCQAFSAAADGYVRAEGGVVLVLQSAAEPKPGLRREHARIVATSVNSDGRTNGIALPSPQRQARLLQQIYGGNGINPNRLAFVEAHGTGTPVGDPVEATALGEVLGSTRREPLPIGSIKSNIGHTEPAAGLAGILKAMLALEHDLLPPTLHCDTLNPHVDFERLGLSVARTAVPLRRERQPRLAGVSSYGFGGTNAHVVIAEAPAPSRPVVTTSPTLLLLSAQSRSALSALAASYADRFDRQPDAQEALVAAANHRRDRLPERLVVPVGRPAEMAIALRRYGADANDGVAGLTAGTAVAREANVAFVFSGNGSQWAGMGRAAFRKNRAFRTAFRAVDDLFVPFAGWSLTDKLADDGLAADLDRTSVAQPLLFAIQVASSRALLAAGLAPTMTLGHSVGEIAAAETAGLITLEQAVRLIFHRSQHQEAAAGKGGMAVLIGPRAVADTLVAEIEGLAIAALNSARATTLSGSTAALDQAGRHARSLQARLQTLDIPYPFHSALIDPIREPFLADLGPVRFGAPTMRFVSTVTGGEPSTADFDNTYWWRNVREPVRFSEAIEAAYSLGARVFLEIGPHPILLSHIGDTLAAQDTTFAALPVLDRQDRSGDPIARAVAAALARGAAVDDETVRGTDPARRVDLPSYPWQRKTYRLENTAEAVRLLTPVRWHPLVGARSSPDGLDWDGQIDTVLLPRLADHVVNGHVLLPGMAFVEMAAAVARDWTGSKAARLADLRILQPLMLDSQGSRETRCRIHPQTTMLEIMSRPRLIEAAWQVHLSAKILRGAERLGRSTRRDWSATKPAMAGEEIYAAASAAGLTYGPAFRLLRSATRLGPRLIGIELVAGDTDERFALDPIRADACLHGLTLLYRELADGQDTCAYVPVTIADVHILNPATMVCAAEIAVIRADRRAIVIDLKLFDEAGDVVATMNGFRLQAVSAVTTGGPQIEVFRRTLVLASEPLAAEAQPGLSAGVLLEVAQRAGCFAINAQPSPDYVLLEGWAMTVALGFCHAVADGTAVIDLPSAMATGRLSTQQASWCERLLTQLVASGLAEPGLAGQFRLVADAGLPDPEAVLRSLAQDHPDRSAELLLAAHATTVLRELAAGHPSEGVGLSVSALDAYDLGGLGAIRSANRVCVALDEAASRWPTSYTLRLLQIGDGPLTERLAELARGRGATLTIVDPNRRRLERARLALNGQPRVTFLDSYEQFETGGYDMVVAAETLGQAFGDAGRWRRLGEALALGGVLLAAEPSPSLFGEVVFGCPHLVGEGSGRAAPLSVENWRRALRDLPLDAITVAAAADADLGWLCFGEKRGVPRGHTVAGAVTLIADGEGSHEIVAAMRMVARTAGVAVSDGKKSPASVGDLAPGLVIYLSTRDAHLSAGEEIARRCLALRDAVQRHGTASATFWVVCPGAMRSSAGLSDEVSSAVWAFARTLANERQTLDLRLIDLDPGLLSERGAQRLLDIVSSGTDETELVVDEASTHAVRFETMPSAADPKLQPSERALRLAKGDGGGGLDRIRWAEEARRAPGPGEIEIEVKAAGLNFRDVMWGLSLLPEEILEDGYAGATLGLECSGVVARVGSGVENLEIGDLVIAFARSALSSHVTIEARYAARRPVGWSFESAATVPVAFLTAYYALVDAARLERDEWVLIHGGAGGVGLAALQIALWRGARVIATAGSAERRELLTVLGAEHVFDSRSMDFADDIQQLTGGVHVVLNSLSGEAMERSLAVLRPFGRFVELGKRDYVANTHVGLRPFRRNLSYHGVDLDQLMSRDDETGTRLFGTITDLFAQGVLTPLPYRVFAGRAIVDAFRLMQRSGHIGKIVIHPPLVPLDVRTPLQPFEVSPTGTHLITGGLSGFGLETARWLVERGARRLVLVGRSGASRPEAEAALAAFADAGVDVEVAALDIADEPAVSRLLAAIAAGDAPLAGVIHAAASYDDAIVDNLDPDRFAAVLRAKVEGAALLDRLTRPLALGYFILFSSATTLVGNPGQGAYVAANAFCEALARRRCREGYPAMAVAWGAIADVGVLARSGTTPRTLLARSGVEAMPARAALDRFAAALPSCGQGEVEPMLAVAAVDWSGARAHLRTLRSPTFSSLTALSKRTVGVAQAKISVQELIEQHGPDAVKTLIADAVREEIARILRLPLDDIGRNKPLMEIGLDSLMGVELAMGLEQRFTLHAPLSASASAMTVNELADFVVGVARQDRTVLDPVSARLADRHLDANTRREVEAAYPMIMERGHATAPEDTG